MKGQRATRSLRNFLAPVLLVAGLGATGPVHGIDITIPGAAFRGNERYSYGYDSSDGFIWAGQGGNPGCFSAPIQLEDYDEILGFSADLFDIDAGSNFGVQLRRHSAIDPAAGAEVVASVSTSGTSTGIVRVYAPSILIPAVNTESYVYYVTTSPCLAAGDSEHRVYGVHVRTALLFADGFESATTAAWGGGPGGNTLGAFRLSVPGAAFFFGRDLSNLYDGWFDPVGGYKRPSEVGGGDPTCDIAPVFLPHGADVQLVDAAIYDNTPDRSITINLRRKRFSNATASAVIATLQSAGSSTFMQFPTVAPSEPIIDNELYVYYLETCQPSPALPLDHTLLRIYEVRLLYRR